MRCIALIAGFLLLISLHFSQKPVDNRGSVVQNHSILQKTLQEWLFWYIRIKVLVSTAR